MGSNSVPSDHQDEYKKVTNGKIDTVPLPQRVLRLNRRGFFISSHQHKGQKRVKIPSSDSAETREDRIKSPPLPAKKILKLSNSSPLKRNSISDTSSQAEETPPKKKHKPITWP